MGFETYRTHFTRGANRESLPIVTIRSSRSLAINRIATEQLKITEALVLEFDRSTGTVLVRAPKPDDPASAILRLRRENSAPRFNADMRQPIVSLRGFVNRHMIDLEQASGRYVLYVSFNAKGTFALPEGSWYKPPITLPPVPPAVTERLRRTGTGFRLPQGGADD